MGFFQDLFGQTAADAARTAADQKAAGLQAGLKYATPYLQQGREAITSGYGQAQNLFAPIVGQAQAGASAYGDITGAAGTEGQDRARALFQTDPGYEFARDQALQATQRLNTGGFQGSGNVAEALQNTAIQKANEQYNNYVSRLAPYLGYSLGATQGGAGAYTGEGNALNAALGNQAQLGYGTEAGVGSAQGAGTLGAAQAETQAAGNIANLGLRLLGFGGGGTQTAGLGGIGAGGNTSLLGGAGPIFGGTNPNAWYTG